MIDFQFHNPTSMEEVFNLLDTYGDDARVMAGGTALVIQMKQRLVQPEHVINLRRVPGMNSIEQTSNGNTGLTIGALCTQQEAATSPVVALAVPIVGEDLPPRGNAAHPAHGDGGGRAGPRRPQPGPAADADYPGGHGDPGFGQREREVALEDFLVDYYETDVRPGEVLTKVTIPAAPTGSGTAYLKFLPRTADDYPTVSAAAIVTVGEGNVCQEIKLALGAVGIKAIHATGAEDALRGRPLTEENIRAAAALVKDVVDPLDDYRGSAGYKRDMAEVFARRAIQAAVANAG